MRRYLATLHKKSDAHKKGFALGVSGGVTLSIFAVWLFVNFGTTATPEAVQANAHEVSPFESLGMSLGSSWEALKESFGGLTQSLGGIDINIPEGYEELKEKTLNQYVR